MNKKRYGSMEIDMLLNRIVISITGKKSVNFSTKENIHIATGYTRVHTSSYGVFVEFNLTQLFIPTLHFPYPQDNSEFFIWRPDNSTIEIYEPRIYIEGTGFSPNFYYINPRNIYTHGLRVLKEIKNDK